MTKDRWLFYRTWAISWIALSCIPSLVVGFLPNYNPTSFDESYEFVFKPATWFFTFPIAWTIALLVVRYQKVLCIPSVKILGRIFLFLGCLIGLPFLFMGCATNAWLAPFPAKFQVETDHGIHLPNSVVVLHRENSGVPWMDSHASADVTIAASDLPDFVKQLEPFDPKDSKEPPWSEKITGKGAEYYCHSKSSDGRFYVTVKPTENGKVKLKLGTVTD